MTKSIERICLQQSSSEYLNLDIDDLSEGDNSVFTEGATTPIEQRMQQVEDVDTDNEAADNLKDDLDKEAQDNQEEVNNIELIFSSDDNKDLTQEDLVSISEYEPWQEAGGSGTPVLMNFNSLSSEDRNREFLNERKLTGSRFCSKPRSKCQSLDLQPGPNLRDKSLESTESLSFDINNKPNSMQSSLDKDSSIENPISRDVSMDTFEIQPNGTLNKKWTNFNVVIETDISKVGIGDNEGILDLGRRNTCPNPPIYRPIIHSQNRQSSRNPIAVKFTRSPRGFCPVLSTKTSRFEPLEEATGGDGKSSSAAQTDISAVPLQWRSEQHLTHSDYSPLFTLPTPHHPFNLRGRNALR